MKEGDLVARRLNLFNPEEEFKIEKVQDVKYESYMQYTDKYIKLSEGVWKDTDKYIELSDLLKELDLEKRCLLEKMSKIEEYQKILMTSDLVVSHLSNCKDEKSVL